MAAAGQPTTPDFGPASSPPAAEALEPAPLNPISRVPAPIISRYEFASPIGIDGAIGIPDGPFPTEEAVASAGPVPDFTPGDEALPSLNPANVHPEGWTQRSQQARADKWIPISHDLGRNQEGQFHQPEHYAKRAPNQAMAVGTTALPGGEHLGYGDMIHTTASEIGLDQTGNPHSPQHYARRAPNSALRVGTSALPDGGMRFEGTTTQEFGHYDPSAIPERETVHNALKLGSQAIPLRSNARHP